MLVINGYRVLALFDDMRSRTRWVLAYLPDSKAAQPWVVASLDRTDPAPTEWKTGMYFADGGRAKARFVDRVSEWVHL